jgi:hypothetical protein
VKQVPRRRNDAIAKRLGFPSVQAWYTAGPTARQMMAEAGVGENGCAASRAIGAQQVC